ncbi:MAG TPA: hypothetical protein VKI44_10110 [Acetobacteraceae bacterium]|nr:hypothetical protein [Acetobacteraceae bacterium]
MRGLPVQDDFDYELPALEPDGRTVLVDQPPAEVFDAEEHRR